MRTLILAALLALTGTGSLFGAARDEQSPKERELNDANVSIERLRKLIGTWKVTASTFGDIEKMKPTFSAVEAAGGRAIYSIFRQGSGADAYEASSLWCYDAKLAAVRVFEVKSSGNVEHHVGGFDDAGNLVCEYRDPKTNELLRRTVMKWSDDTITMEASFFVNGVERKHSLAMVREPTQTESERRPNKSPEPTPTAVTPRAKE